LTVDFKVKEFQQKAEKALQDRIDRNRPNNEILVKPNGDVTVIDKNTLAMRVFPADSEFAQSVAGSQKLGASSGQRAKATAKAVDGFRSKLILNEDLNDLRKDLSDPKMFNLIKQYRVEAFFTEESKWLNQAINSNIPNELQEFLTKVRDIRNNYYLDISGKAVTGGEALRSYGTVPQPGDNPEMMVNKINGMQKRVQNQISFDQQFYGFPAIKVSPGERINLIPGQNYSAGVTDSEAEQALAWANANPETPQAKAIKKRLGVE